ncbi:MAG: VOC family protein [Acidimicrobiia bacterium]
MSTATYPGMSEISVYLHYEDVGFALEWLARTFGFRESLRVPIPNGTVVHAEVKSGDAVLMMGWPGPDYRDPGLEHSESLGVVVYVPDVDAHYAVAAREGAVIESELTDQVYGDRTYRARDYAGHQWTFATHVRTADPSTWGAIVTTAD